MSQVIKAFTGIYLLLLLMVSSTGVLGAFLQTLHAQNLHSMIIDELENSDYARGILEAAYEEAEKYQYDLQLILYRENETAVVCREIGELPVDLQEVFMAEVRLQYEISLTFFDISAPQKLIGYAR
jgi:hypothetical protein